MANPNFDVLAPKTEILAISSGPRFLLVRFLSKKKMNGFYLLVRFLSKKKMNGFYLLFRFLSKKKMNGFYLLVRFLSKKKMNINHPSNVNPSIKVLVLMKSIDLVYRSSSGIFRSEKPNVIFISMANFT